MTCGERIKNKRKELKLTQDELAKKIGLKGGTISKYELDEISIPASNLKLIASVLGVSTDYLLGNTSIINPKEHLEKKLAEYYLTDYEYNLLLNEIFKDNVINLDKLELGSSKINNAFKEILDIYQNYINTYIADINDKNANKEEIIQNIDNNFMKLLHSINKEKIIYKMDSNIFPSTNTPVMLPILGRISAGLPILAVENIDGYDYAPSSKLQDGYEYFFLKVQGDSMNLEFPDGSLLLIQKQPTLEKGQIGVFRINGDDATVKRFKEENGLITLEPRSTNPEHETHTYDPNKISIEIIGKVISYTANIN